MSTINVNRVVDTSGGVLAPISSVFRNRIINGAMAVFQRGTAATADGQYSVDRWRLVKSNDATESTSQNTDAPVGFSYSLRNTISTGDGTIGASQYSGFEQSIEGFNTADLAWGTANAQPVTISFWVRASVIGQYTGNLRNSDASRIYPFNFTITSINTWEYKTITIAGPTDGTWNTTNGAGISLAIYAAIGSNFIGTANSWNSTTKYGSGSPVNGIASNGNIFAITGVQLEKGSTATSFDYRPYGTELALCQRYFYREVGTNGEYSYFATGGAYSTTAGRFYKQFPVTMRATPTYSSSGSAYADGVNLVILFTLFLEYGTPNALRLGFTCASGNGTGHAVFLAQNTSTVFSHSFSSEL